MSSIGKAWDNLPELSKALYKSTYFLEGEDYSDWLHRVCSAYTNNDKHRDRMISYMTNLWFHPSTPISSNGGTGDSKAKTKQGRIGRGLPISCMVQHIGDNRESIFDGWNESCWLGSMGSGIGKYWGDVREINSKVGSHGGESSGVIPFMGVDNNLTLAVSQGGIRRASQAAYLPIWHPEIMEFLDLRNPTGDQSRRATELHHGVVIDDKFMEAVINDDDYELLSPKTSNVVELVKARVLWETLLSNRTTLTGEPYILFIDNVNRDLPEEYVLNKWKVYTSQLCSEIMLHTEENYTAVCCLASVNAEYFDEWKEDVNFIKDCNDFLDNVLTDFINKTEDLEGFENARKSAMYERSIGLGVMGLHSLYQRKGIPFESPMAKGLNANVFKHIEEKINEHQKALPKKASCPLAKVVGTHKRNTTTVAVAPTMSISSLCGVTSSGIEPWVTNAFTKKIAQGSFAIKNKYLDKHIKDYAYNNNLDDSWVEKQWEIIKKDEGSVRSLKWLDSYNKEVFKTAFEIDMVHVIDQASDRQQYIDQGQSLNLFIAANSNVQRISDLHILAWKKGLKSLYYLRSTSLTRGNTDNRERKTLKTQEVDLLSDACPSCG